MLKVEQYHIGKVKFYKQRLNALYGLTDEEKHFNYSKYLDLVKTDRKAIRYHIELVKEIRNVSK